MTVGSIIHLGAGSPATPAPAPPVLTAGLVAEYLFDEPSGLFARAHRQGPSSANLYPATEGCYAGPFWQRGSATVTDQYDVDPTGGYNAARWVTAASTGAGLSPGFNPPLVVGAIYNLSLWVRNNSSSAQSYQQYYNSAQHSVTIPANSGWVRQWVTYTNADGTVAQVLPLETNAAGTAQDFEFYGCMLEVVPSLSTPPSDYRPGVRDAFLAGSPSFTGSGLNLYGGNWYGIASDAGVSYPECAGYVAFNWPLANTETTANSAGLLNELGGLVLAARNGGPYPEGGCVSGSVSGYLANVHDGLEHLLAFSYDGSTFRLWLDDALLGFAPATNAQFASAGLVLGKLTATGETNCFPGILRYASIYNTGHGPAQHAKQFSSIASILAARGVTLSTAPNFVQFDGDSITAIPTTTGVTSYSITAMQGVEAAMPGVQGANFAVGGANVGTSADIAAGTQDTLFGRFTLTSANWNPARRRNVLVAASGRNDMTTTSVSPAQYIANLTAYCAAQRAAGATRIVVPTILPSAVTYSDGTYSTFAAKKAVANTLLRELVGTVIDQLIDYDTNAALSADSAPGTVGSTSPSTYYADGTHPNAAGNAAMAPIAQAAIAAALD